MSTHTTKPPRLEFYTVAETAEILRITRQTVYRHIKSGRIESRRIGARVLIPASVIKRVKRGGGSK